MTDITMCRDDACQNRGLCYRYRAKPSSRQSYFVESPRTGGYCRYFDEMESALAYRGRIRSVDEADDENRKEITDEPPIQHP